MPALEDISLTVKGGEFVTVCGPCGCGKTTFLRQLKPSISPHGQKTGEIYFTNMPFGKLSLGEQYAKIGFVQQSPENQIVTDKVWHELAFGLESLGYETAKIRLRVAEMASFFGIQSWFHKSVAELSGGQKQLLNLASVMTMQPTVLILDEPTSQLDPIAAQEFLATVSKLNRELGLTVILCEQRLEEAFPLSDRVIVLDKGRIIANGTPREAALRLREGDHGMFRAMPTAMRVWAAVTEDALNIDDIPLTVREGAQWLARQDILIIDNKQLTINEPLTAADLKCAIVWDNVWFKYGKSEPDVLKGLSFKANYGEITAVLGGNGVGKTTALSLVTQINIPYRGKVLIGGENVSTIPKLFDGLLGVLPQNPQVLFVKKTVQEDLLEILSERKLSQDEKLRRLTNVVALCQLKDLLNRHPYDLSGGEQQRAALAKILLLQPKILLLDEPTKGLDADFKQIFAGILRKLTVTGSAVLVVSHDVEFCAEYADHCALFFDGNIVSEGKPREFFSGNCFYTTAANRMARKILPQAVTVGDIVKQWSEANGQITDDSGQCTADSGQMIVEFGQVIADSEYLATTSERRIIEDNDTVCDRRNITMIPSFIEAPRLSQLRVFMAAVLLVLLIATMVFGLINVEGFRSFVSGGGEAMIAASNPADSWRYVGIILALMLEFIAMALMLTWGRDKAVTARRKARHKFSKRAIIAAAMVLIIIPLTIYVGRFFLGDRKYYFISLLIILETMLPFALAFERRRPQARELVVIAVLCTIAVAGRAAFFMLPQFKPVIALVIIAGVALGGEAGFLVGSLTGFISNMFFGQGPWTPWQMFAFGIIGFVAGILFHKGLLGRGRFPLAVFGGLVTLAVYGGIMNPAHVLMFQSNPTREMFLFAYLQGLPFDLVHAAATVVFLLLISQPMLEKLDRVKVKYGLME
ncbi:MAG: ATP-binding cassette domain-containing protein [Clostridiales bacterium]|nr:ATP-binding cassette domain-containing protein [Clostridiales bacterium]